jgi:hypothetical protein
MVLEENDILIDFKHVVKGEKFDDDSTHGLSHCMKAVDFIIETDTKILFVEIKDPQNPKAQIKDKNKFLESLQSGTLIRNSLTTKARDTFLYRLGLNALPYISKPIHYYVLINLETLDGAQLLNLTDRLRAAIPTIGPNNVPWKNPFISECAIFNLKTWKEQFPYFQACRKSEKN